MFLYLFIFFFSSRRRHTRWPRDWSSDVCSSDLRAFSAGLDFTELSRIAEDGAVELGARLGSARALAQKAVHIWSLVEEIGRASCRERAYNSVPAELVSI